LSGTDTVMVPEFYPRSLLPPPPEVKREPGRSPPPCDQPEHWSGGLPRRLFRCRPFLASSRA